jgi:hypothetical protein
MATANTPRDLTELRTELTKLSTEREIAQARVDIRELTEQAEQPSLAGGYPGPSTHSPAHLVEDFTDFVNPTGYLFDDPTFNPIGIGPILVPISRLDDRADGKFRPIYETEQQLAFIRGAAHVCIAVCGSASNILTNLRSYTIADGFHHEVQDKPDAADVPKGLAKACQYVIDTAHTENDWKADLEAEVHDRSREDGEAAIVLKPHDGWHTRMFIVEPDQITQPSDPRQLEDYLAYQGEGFNSAVADDFLASWSFGVHSRKSEPWNPLGYHVVRQADGMDWDYYPATDVQLARRIGSGVMELIKRNVPRNVKRGVSDYYQVVQRLERMEKLARNTEDGGAIQAAIAFIREHAPTATQSQIGTLASGAATSQYNKRLGPGIGGTRVQQRQRFSPGTVIDTNGTQYKYGPMGQSSAPNFIAIIQAAMRMTGSRWVMPEYMISSDASNAALASTLVVGSPFVKARQSDQLFYASRFKRMDWLTLRIAFEGGYFERQFPGITWEVIERMIEIVVTPPDITIADDLKNAQVKAIEHANVVLSSETWMKETGRDPDVERTLIAQEKAAAAAAQPAAEPTKVPDNGAPKVKDQDLPQPGERGAVRESLVTLQVVAAPVATVPLASEAAHAPTAATAPVADPAAEPGNSWTWKGYP